MVSFDRMIKVFDRTIDAWGEMGSILAGSLVTLNDQGDETVTWTSTAGSMYVRALNTREIQYLPEGERTDGRLIAYLQQTNDLVAGSRYRIGYSGEDYEVLNIKRVAPAGSLVYTSVDITRVDND